MKFAPFVAGCAAIFFASSLSDPPLVDQMTFRFADKALHACAYGVLGLLALWGSPKNAVLAIALATGYGALDEVHQAFVPKRHADVFDLAADAAGATIAVVFVERGARAVSRRRRGLRAGVSAS